MALTLLGEHGGQSELRHQARRFFYNAQLLVPPTGDIPAERAQAVLVMIGIFLNTANTLLPQ
jgi:hypothetical protein